jgi:hypothetical protein
MRGIGRQGDVGDGGAVEAALGKEPKSNPQKLVATRIRLPGPGGGSDRRVQQLLQFTDCSVSVTDVALAAVRGAT